MPLAWGDMAALVAFHNTIPNNTLPVFWCEGKVNDRPWLPLFPRAWMGRGGQSLTGYHALTDLAVR
jgi:hypothetical protein